MKRLMLVVTMGVLLMGVTVMPAMALWSGSYFVPQSTIATFGQGSASLGEGVQVYFNPGGSTSAFFDPALNTTVFVPGYGTETSYGATYDNPYALGGDDVVIAFKNNSSVTVPSVVLSGSGNGGGLFAWDGDDKFGVGVASTQSADTITGTVYFNGSGLAPGGLAWYAFESSGNTIPNPVGAVPEPATMLLLGSGFLGLAGYGRKKFIKK